MDNQRSKAIELLIATIKVASTHPNFNSIEDQSRVIDSGVSALLAIGVTQKELANAVYHNVALTFNKPNGDNANA